MARVVLILFMVLTIGLLLTSMVLSAMASYDSKKSAAECQEKCHKWSMWSALVSGISAAVIVAVLIYYIYSSRAYLVKGAGGLLQRAGGTLTGKGDSLRAMYAD